MPLTAEEQAELDELEALTEPTDGGLTADEEAELAGLEALGKRPATQQQLALRRAETPVDKADRIIRDIPGNIGRGVSDMLGRILDPAGDDKAREKFALPERLKSDILPEFMDASPLDAALLVLGRGAGRTLRRVGKAKRLLKRRMKAQGKQPASRAEKTLSKINAADVVFGRRTLGGLTLRALLRMTPGTGGIRALRKSPLLRQLMRKRQLEMQRARGATTRRTGRPRDLSEFPSFFRGP